MDKRSLWREITGTPNDATIWELQRALSDVIRGKVPTYAELRPTFLKFLEQFTFRVDDERRTTWFLIDDVRLAQLIDRNAVPKRQSSPLAPQERAAGRP